MKVILIGAKGFGKTWHRTVKSHGLEVVAVVDIELEHSRDAVRELGQGEPLTLQQWISRPTKFKADLIIDSAPPFERFNRLRAALTSGIQVLAAKPLLTNMSEFEALLHLEEETQRRVFVAMQKRFHPAFQKLFNDIRDRRSDFHFVKLILEVDGEFWTPGFEWRKKMKHPSLWEGAIHQLDLLKWLLDLRVRHIWAKSFSAPWSNFESPPDFLSFFECENDIQVVYLSRWNNKSRQPIHYFSGLTLESARDSFEIKDGRLFQNGVYCPTTSDEERMMDLSVLNEQLFKALFITEDIDARMTLSSKYHYQVMEWATLIERAF